MIEEAVIPTNEYQTPITRELLEMYPDEIQEWFLDAVNNIPFVKSLISPDRRYARDLERDEKGRIIVDIENPHICENMDYFRPAALFFEKHGCYTLMKPNSNPQSEYRKFWAEELRRCREGYVRESDGEWVTGYCYWFLNYTPMMVNKITKGSKRANRQEGFPFFFEGIYWRFHYLQQARDKGEHAIELAKRGAHPYFEKVYTPDGLKCWGDIQIGDTLFTPNGGTTKVVDIPNNGIMPCYRITLLDGRTVYASDDHLWEILEGCDRKKKLFTTKELAEYPVKMSSTNLYRFAIPSNNGVEYMQREVPIDAYTFGFILGDGTFCHTSMEIAQCEEDMKSLWNEIPYRIVKCDKDCHYIFHIPDWRNILKGFGLLNVKSIDKFIPDIYKFNSREVRLAVLQGLFDTDGWCCEKRSPQFCTISKRMADDVAEIARSLGYEVRVIRKKSGYKKDGVRKSCSDSYTITLRTGGKELFRLKRKQDKCPTTKYADYASIKSIEYIGEELCKCVTVDNPDNTYLIGEYVTTHNCGKSYTLSSIMSHNLLLGESKESTKRIITVLAAYQKEYLKDDKDGTFSKFIPSISFLASNTPFPRLMLKNSPNEMSWQMGYLDKDGTRKGSFNTVMGVSIKEDVGKLRGKRGIILFEEMGNMPGLLTVYDTCRRSVEDGDYSFGQMYLVGTASEKESDFSSAKTLLYQTSGYHLKTLDNVFDRVGSGKNTFGFFFPAYINRAGCYNKDGVSDIVKALLEIFKARYVAKYGTDPQSVLRVIAEDPITPAEAIIKVKAAYFPVADINEQLNFIDSHPRFFDDTYIGELVFNSDKRSVRFSPNADTPIREFGVRNDTPGALEIYQMPVKNSTGVVPYGRYIIGHDPVDNDQADSSSLSSTFVFDLFTDEIVAEFTGRRAFAEDNWEICRRLCIFYNARCLYESNRKGLFAYFQKYNSLNYLADTPQYLRDKGLVKYNAFGNNTKGVNASAAINGYANSLLREWLKKTKTVIMKDDKGEEYETQQMNVFTVKSKAFLQECAAFTPEINVDRIRAMGMVMLLREETQILYQGEVSRMELEKQKDYAGDDPFFSDNYDDRYGNSKFSNFDFE